MPAARRALPSVAAILASLAFTARKLCEPGPPRCPLDKLYFGYTTCPSCAKAYGKNYVVLFAKVDDRATPAEPPFEAGRG